MKAAAFALVFAATLLSAMAQPSAQSAGGDQDKGVTTGWSAGTKDQSGPDASQALKNSDVHDDAEAPNQPALATGLDLNGPSKQFPPSKTPE
jgi:hypothetical protein